MAHQKLKVCGTLEGWIPNFFEEPTYKNEPCDFRLKIRVTEDADELREILRDNYNKLCDWYRKTSGNRRFFAEPWIENEDGSVTVRVTAKPKYQEFPFPVVDGDLESVDEDLTLREGTTVLVSTVLLPYSPKSPQGGMRIRPRAIQIIEAVTYEASDSGDLDLEEEFTKTKGYKKSKPNVKKSPKKSDNVPDDDEDF
jgi:hypothetical protein